MNKEILATLEKKLITDKENLIRELESFATEDKDIKGNWDAKYVNKEKGDLEEEADESQEYENLLSLEQNLELKLRDVNLALEKIKNGTYGACEKCGAHIDEDRLMACPEASRCMKCNAK